MQWIKGSEQFTNALASSQPTPGGGAAAAVAGAMGCALLLMALRTTLKRKQTPLQIRPALEQHITRLSSQLTRLQNLAAQDAQAYDNYLSATQLPKEDPARPQALQETLWQAACVPADTAAVCQAVLQVAAQAAALVDPIIISDVKCAQHLLASALACCAENIRANATYITQPKRAEKLQKLLEQLAQKTL